MPNAEDDIHDDVLNLAQEHYALGEMDILVEGPEHVCMTEIPEDVRSLAQELHATGEMEISLECEDNCDITYARENSASSSGSASESFEGNNTGLIFDDESCAAISEEKRGKVSEAHIPNYNSFLDFEEEAYIPSSIVRCLHKL